MSYSFEEQIKDAEEDVRDDKKARDNAIDELCDGVEWLKKKNEYLRQSEARLAELKVKQALHDKS